MAKLLRADISFMLNEIAQALDIPDSLYEAAVSKYQAVGSWLGAGNSPLAGFSPQIYPQGSFRLGTITKPLSEADDYDIDLVFELAISKDEISQQRLKNLVGDRMKANEIYRKMLDEEGDRCWTLEYADSAQFHMDILPAIPDHNNHPFLESQGVPSSLARTSIAITDKGWPNYARIDPDWPRCNPKGYAAWFRQQMIIRYDDLRKRFALGQKAQMESIPEYKIKTPLQRCVQLLKRHRDIRFVRTPDIQPASIILTTLAANAYRNEADLMDALFNILNGMPNYISVRYGVTWVANPMDPSENFADRWQNHSDREPAFRSWIKQVRTDLNALLACDDIDEINELLASLFGEKLATIVVNRFKELSPSSNAIGSAAVVVTSNQPVVTIPKPMKPWGW